MKTRVHPIKEDKKNQLEIHAYESLPMTEDALNSPLFHPETSEEESRSEITGLTERRKKYTLSHPIQNKKAQSYFLKARAKLRGVLLWNKIRDEIQTFGTGSHLFDAFENYRENINHVMKSKTRILEKPIVKQQTYSKTLFHPNSKFKSTWNLLVMILLLYVFTVTPWVVAFEEVQTLSTLFFVELTVDFLFFCDIIITLNTAYYDRDGLLVQSRRRIFSKYLKGMLLVDILAILPFQFFVGNQTARSNALIRFLRISKITRVFRASKILGIMKSMSSSRRMQRLIELVRTYDGITRIVSATYIILLMAHFTACMWYYTAKLDGLNYNTWVSRHGFEDSDKFTLYMAGFYWAFTILTTVGFGDIHAYTTSEMIICILWMLFGIVVYSYLISNLTSVLSSIDAKQSKINEKVTQIERFCKEFDVSADILKQMKKFVKKKNVGDEMEEGKRVGIVKMMPKKLRYKTCMAMYGGAAYQIPFLTKHEPNFVCYVLPLLSYQEFSNNEKIYEKGDSAEFMYFLVEGRVNYVFGIYNFVFKSIVKGSYFGEIEILKNQPRKFSTMAEGKCKLLCMSKSLLNSVLDNYSYVASEIKEVAEKRRKCNSKALKDTIEVLDKVEIRRECDFKDLVGQKKIKKEKIQAINLPQKLPSTKYSENHSGNFFESQEDEIAKLKDEVRQVNKKVDYILSLLEKSSEPPEPLEPPKPKEKPPQIFIETL
mgnify:CR=1 FL=1